MAKKFELELAVSTNNKNKIEELRDLLKNHGTKVLSKTDLNIEDFEVDEIYSTLEENASLKAKALYDISGKASIADDTGLFVESLNGEPGVHSARYASDGHDDKANIVKLLDKLKYKDDRRAYFKTVISFINEKGEELLFSGICKGEIVREPRGKNGFGYDSIFMPEGYDKTFAELSSKEKNAISHRNKAIENFIKHIEKNEH